MTHDCPKNCAVRRALALLNPERAAFVQDAITSEKMTRREVCQLFLNEAKVVVYPGSVSRHRSHQNPLEAILTESKSQPQPLSPTDLRSAEQFVTQEYERLRDIKPESLSPSEQVSVFQDSMKAMYTYYRLNFDEKTGGMDMGYFYNPVFQCFSRLFSALKPPDFKPPARPESEIP